MQWQFICRYDTYCTRSRFTVMVSCSDKLAVHSCPLLCLQRWVAKLASRLFYCWSLLCNNSMTTNLQRFTSCNSSRRFVALLNADLAGNAARQWHADSGKPRAFILCEKSMSESAAMLPHIGVRECIFLGMQRIFAQIWSCFFQITYKQQVLMLRLKLKIANKSRCLQAIIPITGFQSRTPSTSNQYYSA